MKANINIQEHKIVRNMGTTAVDVSIIPEYGKFNRSKILLDFECGNAYIFEANYG